VCFISVEAPDLTGFIRRFTGKTAYNGTISPQSNLGNLSGLFQLI
jgi:hypothetical protein